MRFLPYTGHIVPSWRHRCRYATTLSTQTAWLGSGREQQHGSRSKTSIRRFAAIIDENLIETVRPPEEVAKLPRIYIGQVQLKPVPVSSMSDLAKATTSKTKRLQIPPLIRNSLVHLSEDQAHYIMTVLRLFKKYTADSTRPSPQIRVFADGEEWLADLLLLEQVEIGENSKRRGPPPAKPVALCRHHLGSLTKQRARDPPIHCWLCVAPPKNKDRTRWMIEKTTEMDCTGYVLLDTEYSEGSDEYQLKKFPKMQAYCIEAAEQCERLDLPHFITVIRETNPNPNTSNEELRQELLDVPNITKLTEFLQVWSEQAKSGVVLLVCRERSNTMSVWSALQKIYTDKDKENDLATSDTTSTKAGSKTKAVAFLIGPEGGWSPTEQRLLNVLERDFPDSIFNVSLGRTILRTETAAITAMAAFALHRDFVRNKK
jgi:RsmE family RNA methyltransferase